MSYPILKVQAKGFIIYLNTQGQFLIWVKYFHLRKWSSYSQFFAWKQFQINKVILKSSLYCTLGIVSSDQAATVTSLHHWYSEWNFLKLSTNSTFSF